MKTVTLRASSIRSILQAIDTHIDKLTSEGVNYNKLRPFILAGKEIKRNANRPNKSKGTSGKSKRAL